MPASQARRRTADGESAASVSSMPTPRSASISASRDIVITRVARAERVTPSGEATPRPMISSKASARRAAAVRGSFSPGAGAPQPSTSGPPPSRGMAPARRLSPRQSEPAAESDDMTGEVSDEVSDDASSELSDEVPDDATGELSDEVPDDCAGDVS